MPHFHRSSEEEVECGVTTYRQARVYQEMMLPNQWKGQIDLSVQGVRGYDPSSLLGFLSLTGGVPPALPGAHAASAAGGGGSRTAPLGGWGGLLHGGWLLGKNSICYITTAVRVNQCKWLECAGC